MALSLRLDVQVPSIFGRAQLLQLTRELAKYENDWAKALQKKAQIYAPPTPAQRAGGGYRRTYRLRRNWKVHPARFLGQDLTVMLLNDTPYAGRVQGNSKGGGQAPIHQGRWTLFHTLALQSDFSRGAQEVITRNIHSAVSFRSSIGS